MHSPYKLLLRDGPIRLRKVVFLEIFVGDWQKSYHLR